MPDSVFVTILMTGFTVAFFHAAIPTHWLPFVLTARIQKWNRSKTLAITALAGGGHVLLTAVLGFLIAWCGIVLNEKIGAVFPWVAGGALILFGLYYVIQQWQGKGHGHSHFFGGHKHEALPLEKGPLGGIMVDTGHGFMELTIFETGVPPCFRLYFYNQGRGLVPPPGADSVKIQSERPNGDRQAFRFSRSENFLQSIADLPEPHEFRALVTLSHGEHAHTYEVLFEEQNHDHGGHSHGEGDCHGEPVPEMVKKSDKAAIASLFALLTFSPCEGFLPVYVSGVKYGWTGFLLLTVVLSLATVAGMVFFTALTLAGMERFKLQFLEKYESGILGGLLVLLGILIIFLEA